MRVGRSSRTYSANSTSSARDCTGLIPNGPFPGAYAASATCDALVAGAAATPSARPTREASRRIPSTWRACTRGDGDTQLLFHDDRRPRALAVPRQRSLASTLADPSAHSTCAKRRHVDESGRATSRQVEGDRADAAERGGSRELWLRADARNERRRVRRPREVHRPG